MDRTAFVNLYLDEMTGLLLSAFSACGDVERIRTDDHYIRAGKSMIDAQRRARKMLERMYDELQGVKK